MKKEFCSILMGFFCLSLVGCEYLASSYRGQAEQAEIKGERDRAVYEPYEKSNTIEAYSEFIKKYPNNYFVDEARLHIEEITYHNCTTAACIKDYLTQYPEGKFSYEAKNRLQELEIRDFDKELQRQYGFDLLLYKANLNSLKKQLVDEDKQSLAGFTPSFSVATFQGKKYFCTHIAFDQDEILSKILTEEMRNAIFDDILSEQLDYLNVKFKGKHKIEGFSFEIASSSPGSLQITPLIQFIFPINQINLYQNDSIPKEKFIKNSMLILPAAIGESVRGYAAPGGVNDATPIKPPVFLQWSSKKDGTAKGGLFVRETQPDMRFHYPEELTINPPWQNFIFRGAYKRTTSLNLFILQHDASSMKDDAGRKLFAEGNAGFIFKQLKSIGAANIKIEYVRPAEAIERYPVYEFLIRWQTPLHWGINPISLLIYDNIIFKENHIVILDGSVPSEIHDVSFLKKQDVNYLKNIYRTLTFSDITASAARKEKSESLSGKNELRQETVSPAPQEAGGSPSLSKEGKSTIPPLAFMSWSSDNDGIGKGGRFVRRTTPAFVLQYPEDLSGKRSGDRWMFESQNPDRPLTMDIRIAKITGDEMIYMRSVAYFYESLFRQKGSYVNLVYHRETDVYGDDPAYEFEISYQPKGGKSASSMTAYGNVIAKEGYAIILIGEVPGEIDDLKSIYETIKFKFNP